MRVFLITLLSAVILSFAQGASTFKDEGAFKIDSIQYHIGDAFDDSRTHTKYDKWAYDLLNWVHIETRESTIRKLLLFNEGDTITPIQIQESEKFLRTQNYLSDASISLENADGQTIAHVTTSDNWTLSPTIPISHPGSKWNDGLGIQESNFLGFGQKLGFLYVHNEFRDMLTLSYSAPHFLFRYNHLDLTYSYNTDGYLASAKMYLPFLSRSQNQWAYTFEGLKNERTESYYGSGLLPPGAKAFKPQKEIEDVPHYNSDNEDRAVQLMKVEGFIEDSLSFRVSRSFGGNYRKLYLGATYDYHKTTASQGTLYRDIFIDGGDYYAIDSTFAVSQWLPEKLDSRLGLYLQLSNIHYTKAVNLHHVKWTEDVEKGYNLKGQISKNYEQIGSDNNDIRLDFWGDMYLGAGMHHLTFESRMFFYLDHGTQHDYYGNIGGEYIFHPTKAWSTAIYGQADFYKYARYGYQLSLGGINGFAGFPTNFYSGQARVYGSLEQRYFPNFEMATLMPVFAIFGNVGETAWDFNEIKRKDLIYAAGACVYFAQTKSISKLINKIGISVPVNGSRKGKIQPIVIVSYSL